MPGSSAAEHGITGSHEIVSINGTPITRDMKEPHVVGMLGPKPAKVMFRLAPAAPVVGSQSSMFGTSSPSSNASSTASSVGTSSMFGISKSTFGLGAKAGPAGKDLLAFEVECPPDHSAGDLFRMQAPNGRMYEVKVPHKTKTGDKFVVHVDATVSCDGYLYKLSNSRFSGFQKRWFQIHQGVLEYYQHQNEAKAQLEGLPTVRPIKAIPLTELRQGKMQKTNIQPPAAPLPVLRSAPHHLRCTNAVLPA